MTTQPQHPPHYSTGYFGNEAQAYDQGYESATEKQQITIDALVAALGEMTIWASKNAPEAIINNALAVLKLARREAS